jgi:hypothetical protein
MYVAIALVTVASFSALMLWSSRHQRMLSAARNAISRGKTNEFACDGITTGRSFRKRLLGCFSFPLLFLVPIFVDYWNANWRCSGGQTHASFSLIADVCVLGPPFLLTVGYMWTYRVFIFTDHIRIRSFRTRTLNFENMRDLSIENEKFTYCVIQMKDGERVYVDADLADFVGFVGLLSQKIRATG